MLALAPVLNLNDYKQQNKIGKPQEIQILKRLEDNLAEEIIEYMFKEKILKFQYGYKQRGRKQIDISTASNIFETELKFILNNHKVNLYQLYKSFLALGVKTNFIIKTSINSKMKYVTINLENKIEFM